MSKSCKKISNTRCSPHDGEMDKDCALSDKNRCIIKKEKKEIDNVIIKKSKTKKVKTNDVKKEEKSKKKTIEKLKKDKVLKSKKKEKETEKKVVKKIKDKKEDKEIFNVKNNLKQDELYIPTEYTGSIKPSSWELQSRERFIDWINKEFSNYEIESKLKFPDVIGKKKESEITNFTPFTYQRFIRDYMQYESPYRGILVYHGLGSGKTCTSIGVAEGLKTKRQIIVMSPASLEANYIYDLKRCGSYL